MSDSIIVALITSAVTILTVILNGMSTRSKMTTELDKNNALQQQEIQHIKDDMAELKLVVKEHNGYAKMFSESAISTNLRLDNLEKRLS